MIDETPYNPLEKLNLGESVADALLNRPITPLPPENVFPGAGIYPIYYLGGFEPYRPISERNQDDKYSFPIYVGKAVPAGARKGGLGLGINPGQVLYKRLREHAESIVQANNLNIDDFKCRYLVVDDIWIPLGEAMIISKFFPVWNHVIDGFGNHDPGKGRYNQQRSPWDVIHPGSTWADRCIQCNKSETDILESLDSHLKKSFPE